MTLFTLPTSRRVTQDWGQDFNWLNGKYYPNGFYATIGWLGHNGIDYGCPEGDPVESVCDGIVEYVGPGNNHPLLTGGGNTVLVRNDELGMRFEYLHLSQQNVYTGQKVKRGQVIALSGNTGTSTAPHLHVGAIPVKPNLNNGYRGRVDLTGWLYGPSNPDYAGIAAQGTITTVQEDDMGHVDTISDDAAKRIAEHVHGLQVKREGAEGTNTLGWSLGAEGQRTDGTISRTAQAAVAGVLFTKFPRQGEGQSGETDLASVISWFDHGLRNAGTANGAPAAGPGIDPEQIKTAIAAAVTDALSGLSVTLTAEGK